MKKRLVNKGKTTQRDRLTPAVWRQLENFQALSLRMAGFLHQLKTPLHVIQSQAELLLETPSLPADTRTVLNLILQNAERLGAQTRTLLDVARGVRQSLQAAPLGPVLEEICRSVQSDCRKKNLTLQTDLRAVAPVLMEPVTLQGALHNLVANAVEALPAGGSLRVASVDDPKHVRVEIRDSGPGMSRAQLARLEKPFATSKEDGTGLGIFIARHIFKQHKASLRIASAEGQGTTVTVAFPKAA